ncbi:hypothetical protein [Streptomyces inhibens]|uniref:hypothetical protein n=1 Tax=Streptomyces inhibens TaxID=2293571 RepID=UPI001C6DDEC3|nr:hypothetical protein [Streptomyces inhibens]
MGASDVIPAHWARHHRCEDSELLGYLRPVDDNPLLFTRSPSSATRSAHPPTSITPASAWTAWG